MHKNFYFTEDKGETVYSLPFAKARSLILLGLEGKPFSLPAYGKPVRNRKEIKRRIYDTAEMSKKDWLKCLREVRAEYGALLRSYLTRQYRKGGPREQSKKTI